MRLGLAAAVLSGAAAVSLLAAQPSLNAYFQSTLEDPAYQKKTFDRVAKAWKSPPAKSFPKIGAKAVVQAVIGKDGKLASASVSMASGSKTWDAAALQAVKGGAPYDALPAGYKHPSVEVHFHFEVVK